MNLTIKYLTYIFIILLPSLVSYQLGIRHTTVVMVDLQKIITAESVLTNKIVENGSLMKPWLSTVNGLGKELSQAIRDVAGKNSLVLITPCVIQGAKNITDDVLVRLGLPRKVPNPMISINAIFPGSQNNNANENQALNKEKIPSWMLP
jgi:hypothetical protein